MVSVIFLYLRDMFEAGQIMVVTRMGKYFMSSHHIVVHILNLTYLLW